MSKTPEPKPKMTELQYNKIYRKIKPSQRDKGELGWNNSYYTYQVYRYDWAQTQPMTEKQKEAYLEERRAYRRELYKKNKERQRQLWADFTPTKKIERPNFNDIDYKSRKILVFDTETIGLNPCAGGLLQVSIIDGDGNTVFNQYIKPNAESWPEAEAVNHISPEMVADAHPVDYYRDTLNQIFGENNLLLVGYNGGFDEKFLRANGIEFAADSVTFDVMTAFAPVYGDWQDYYKDFKWQKLTTCADYYGYDWSKDTAHNSLSDCKATLYCFRQMM